MKNIIDPLKIAHELEKVQNFTAEERKAFMKTLTERMNDLDFFITEEAISMMAGGTLIAYMIKRENPELNSLQIGEMIEEMSN